MAVTFSEATLVGDGLWRLAWTSDQGPPYYVYSDGILIATQDTPEYFLRVDGDSYPIVEVLDDPDEIPQPAHPDHIVLGWPDDAGVGRYVVEQYTGGQWVERAMLYTDGLTPWWSYATSPLADETVHQWRVTPYDVAGNAGTPIGFSTLLVRYPAPPEVTYAYSAGTGKVTISAA